MFNPCCCAGCIFVSDDYTADSLSAYEQTPPSSWSIPVISGLGRQFVITTTNGARILAKDRGSPGKGKLLTAFKVSEDGAIARAFGCVQDWDNLLSVEVKLVQSNGFDLTSTAKLFARISGVDTQLGFTYNFPGNLNIFYNLELCWDGSKASFRLFSQLVADGYREGPYTGTGTQVGLGASPGQGTVYFDSLLFTRHNSEDSSCPKCTGPFCCNQYPAPALLHLHVEKIAPFGGQSCALGDGPFNYELRYDPGNPAHTNENSWSYAGFGGICTNLSFNVFGFFCTAFNPVGAPYFEDCSRNALHPSIPYVLGPEERWHFSWTSNLGPVQTANSQLLSCRPFHAILEFTECIFTNYGFEDGPGGGLQGWRIEVTE